MGAEATRWRRQLTRTDARIDRVKGHGRASAGHTPFAVLHRAASCVRAGACPRRRRSGPRRDRTRT
eukprot:3486734-Pleurochrysis_carterae.AAC.2